MFRQNLQQLVRYTLGHSLHTLIGPLLSIILVPLYSRVMGTALYGQVDLLISTGSIFFAFSMLGMQHVLTSLYGASDVPLERHQAVAGVLRVGVYWSLLVLLVITALARPIALLLNHPDFEWMLRVSALSQFMLVVYTIQLTLLRLKEQIMRANLLAILFLLINFASILILVVVLKWYVWGVIWANLLTNTVVAVLGLALAKEGLRVRPRAGQLLAIARAGILFLPSSLAVWVLVYEDRVFLTHTIADNELSLYSMASRLAALLGVLVTPFIAAWTPFALRIKLQEGVRDTFSRVLTYSMTLAWLAALGMSLFSYEIIHVMSKAEFAGAYRYMWLLAPIGVVSVWNAVVTIGLYITQHIKYIAYSMMLAALINTLLNIALIGPFKIYGASIATLIAYLVGGIANAFFTQRIYPVPYRWWSMAWALICYLVLAGLGASLENSFTLISVLLRVSLLGAFVGLMVLGRVIEPQALALVRRSLRQPRQTVRWILRRQD